MSDTQAAPWTENIAILHPNGVSVRVIRLARSGSDPAMSQDEEIMLAQYREIERLTSAQSQPAPPVPSSVQEIMRLMMPYVLACVRFAKTPTWQIDYGTPDVRAAFAPLEAALTALVDDNHRLKFELDGVRAMRGPEWISVDSARPVMADDDDDVEVWTWDGTSVREDEYGAIFEQPAGPAVGGWVRVGDGFSGDSYTREATHWMLRHKPMPPPTHGIEPEQGGNHGNS